MKKLQFDKLRDINRVMDHQDRSVKRNKLPVKELLRLFGDVKQDDKGNIFVFAEEDDSLS